jgi:hypothetical protein
MPVNFLDIRNQIAEKGLQAREFEKLHKELLILARRLLEDNSDRLDWICQRIETASDLNGGLRCAVPCCEKLTFACPPEVINDPYVILAADGSQIIPSRHDQVEFGVINVGAIRITPGKPEAPREKIKSQLLALEELVTPDGYSIGEEVIALRRDLYERKFLVELAGTEQMPVVALTDGPLELFHAPRDENRQIKEEYGKLLKAYLEILGELADLKAVVGGYVDKPKSDLVLRMLEILDLKEHELDQIGKKRKFHRLSDASLFAQLLKLGERSAVFSIQSSALKENFKQRLALHFFYLNSGFENHHSLARVEIPAWVAEDAQLLNLLHAVLIIQCRQMGTRPYPYAIHRAHEIAVVGLDEKQQLLDLIVGEWRQQGVTVDDISNKQAGKNAFGSKKRY